LAIHGAKKRDISTARKKFERSLEGGGEGESKLPSIKDLQKMGIRAGRPSKTIFVDSDKKKGKK